MLRIVLLSIVLLATTEASLGAEGPAVVEIPSLTPVHASEIIDRMMSNQAVEYKKVMVVGNLDLSDLDRPIAQTVKITNSTFRDDITFDKSTFNKGVNLSGCTFLGNASFAEVQFEGDANFAATDFARPADFRVTRFEGLATFISAHFREGASFGYSQFAKIAIFAQCIFDGEAAFPNAQFNGDAIFLQSRIEGDGDFQLAQFASLASFWNARLGGEADFLNAQFLGTANFGNATFAGNATFVGTQFSGNVVFREARFGKDAYFGLANFEGFSDFTASRFEGLAIFAVTKFADNARFLDSSFDGQLVLESARIYSMQLDGATFGPKATITLKDADFTRLMARWNAIKDRLVYDPTAYLALVKNYRNLEWRTDANDCYYRYRRLSQAQEGLSFAKLNDLIAWQSCGYGVRPSYTIIWSVILIILFGLAYWGGNGIRKRRFGEEEGGGEARISLGDAMHFSAMTFTAQSPPKLYPVDLYKHVAMVQGLLGWFLLGLFVVVLSGALIR